MTRPILIRTLLVLSLAASARAQNTQGRPTPTKKDAEKEARLYAQGAQAAVYTALAHSLALEALAEEPGELAGDMALSYIKTINRNINECRNDLVSLGQSVHSAEKSEHMKALRAALDEAMKEDDKAHSAVDGHGELGPAAKNTTSHLNDAMAALVKLADAVGAKLLPAPGAETVKAAKDR